MRKNISRWSIGLAGVLLCGGILFTPLSNVVLPEQGSSICEAQTQNGWETVDGKTYYYVNGKKTYLTYRLNGKLYFFDGDTGEQKTGFVTYGINTYYFQPSSTPTYRYAVTGSKVINGKLYFFSDEGAMEKNMWHYSGDKRMYMTKDGSAAVGWTKIGTKQYYFDPQTADMKTGWLTIGSKKYYLGADGVMVTGKKTIGGKVYEFDSNGVLKTSGSSVTPTPAVKNGWQKINGKWYYYVKGKKVTGWKQISKKWYLFKSNGVMASNEYVNGYWLNKDGSWTYKARASWKKVSGKWKYVDTKGWYAKSTTLKIDNKSYSFDAKGFMK